MFVPICEPFANRWHHTTDTPTEGEGVGAQSWARSLLKVNIKELKVFTKINNGNWNEWSAIWSEIIRVVSEFDLKSQVWLQTKIALHEVQLPLYYIHF